MNYRIMFSINAIVAAVLGAVLFVMPEFVLTQLESETYVSTQLAVRFLGGVVFLTGLLLWFLKDVAPAKMQKTVAFILLAGSVVGFILSLLGISSIHIFRSNGWALLVLYGFFSFAYAYILFLQPKSSEAKSRTPRKAKETPPANSGQSA